MTHAAIRLACLRFPALLLFLLVLCNQLNAAEPAVQVSLFQHKPRKLGNYRGHKNQVLREQTARFILGQKSFRIAYKAGYDTTKPGLAFPLEGYIGMPGPNACNWYHSGFLWVLLDGQDIGKIALSSMLVSETGKRGIIDLVWHHQLADVRVRFLGLPGKDHLYAEIRVEPKQTLKSIAIKLRCYPSFFTAFHKRKGARRIQTPGMLVEQGKRVKVAAGDNWWAVYYDEIFDPARGEGKGPCAMLLDPGQADTTWFNPGSYAVDTRVQYKPEARSIRLVFWDFKGMTNVEAIKHVRESSAAVLARLQNLDFTPRSVRDFDLATMRQEMEQAMADPEVRKRIGKKITAVQKWLATLPATTQTLTKKTNACKIGKPAWSVSAEEQFLRRVAQYNDFIWQVKLARLLAGV